VDPEMFRRVATAQERYIEAKYHKTRGCIPLLRLKSMVQFLVGRQIQHS
jgi:hypothetical protein